MLEAEGYSQTMLLIPLNLAANRLASVCWYSAGGVPAKVTTGTGLVAQDFGRIPLFTAAVGSGPYLAAATQLHRLV